jgi:hypothetical protein
LEVHAAERKILHDVPGDDGEATRAILELQDVVDLAACSGCVEMPKGKGAKSVEGS